MNVIVFGGSSGIGKAVAKKFSENGHTVYICGRNRSKLEYATKDIRANGFYSVDLTNPREVRILSLALKKSKFKIDVLINSVGDLIPKSLDELTLSEWNYMFRINTTPTFLLYKYFVPLMNKNSYWFNISSTAGLRPRPDWAGYSISKVALNALTKMIGEKLKPNNLVNAIVAGRTDTPLRKKAYPRGEPEGTLLNPSRIADYIYALVDAKIFIYAQILEIKLGIY